MTYELIEVTTKPSGFSATAYLRCLTHVVTVDTGSEWVDVEVESEWEDHRVYLSAWSGTDDEKLQAWLADRDEIREAALSEWQSRAEEEACDGA